MGVSSAGPATSALRAAADAGFPLRYIPEFLDVDHSEVEDRSVTRGMPNQGGVMAAPDSTAPSDSAQQALISLVIRGMARGAPDEATAQLVQQGLAMTKGPITMPTPDGTAAAAALLRLTPSGPQEQDLDKLFDGFLPINRRLRDVCSAWQTRPDGTPNDHSDGSYDDTVRDRLADVHSP